MTGDLLNRTGIVVCQSPSVPHSASNRAAFTLHADGFLRHALLTSQETAHAHYCLRPGNVRNPKVSLGKVMEQRDFERASTDDHLIADETILLWTNNPCLVTSADLMDGLFQGLVKRIRAGS